MDDIKIVGVFRAFGLLSKQAQGVVRKNCEAGHAEKMKAAVSYFLLVEGVAKGLITTNSGIKEELMEKARADCEIAALAYHEGGGVLTAKEYCSIGDLSRATLEVWDRSFSQPLEVTKVWPMSEEVEHRLTVVALKASQVIAQKAVSTDYPGKVLLIPVDGLEGLCQSLARTLYEALELPNETIHELLHGET